MNKLTTINSPVVVTAIGFDREMHAYPRRMEWQGRVYDFIDSGLRVRRGQLHDGTITMSDGIQSFCLRRAGEGWTLLDVC